MWFQSQLWLNIYEEGRKRLTCFCFKCRKKRFLLKEILIIFPLHGSSTAHQQLMFESWIIQLIITHQGKKLEQTILQNIATPLEVKPTIKGVLLVSWKKTGLTKKMFK